MHFVTISDRDDRGVLAFDLRDVLDALGEMADQLCWQVSYIEATGPTAEWLESFARTGMRIDGRDLKDLARGLLQTIDAELVAFADASSNQAAIVVRAVDSAFFDVLFEDRSAGELLKARFKRVTEPEVWSGGDCLD